MFEVILVVTMSILGIGLGVLAFIVKRLREQVIVNQNIQNRLIGLLRQLTEAIQKEHGYD